MKKIKSGFAILDVTTGAKPLAKHFKARPLFGPCPEEMRVPVTLTGYIENVWGGHDGTSQEFTMRVETIEVTT